MLRRAAPPPAHAARLRISSPCVPARSISRVTKAARLVQRDPPPHFTPDGKRIFNTRRYLFNMNKRIDWAAEQRDSKLAMQTFAALKYSGVQPDIISYTTLLKSFVQAQQWAEAETTFASITQAGLKPNEFSYGHMLEAYGRQGKVEQVLQTADNLRRDGFGANETLLQALMIALGRCGARAEVDKLWAQARENKWPSRYTWNSYVSALIRCKDFAAAEAVYKEMKAAKGKNTAPNRQTYIHLLSHLVRTGNKADMTKAERYVAEMRKDVAVVDIIYHQLMEGWLNVGEHDKAVALLEDMRKNNVRISSTTYDCLIHGCLKQKWLPKADVLLLDLMDAHLRPFASTLKHLANAHREAGNTKRATEVEALIEKYKRPEPTPDPLLKVNELWKKHQLDHPVELIAKKLHDAVQTAEKQKKKHDTVLQEFLLKQAQSVRAAQAKV